MLLSNWHSDMETVALAYPCSLLKLPHDISYMLMTQLWARDFFLRPWFPDTFTTLHFARLLSLLKIACCLREHS